jgi:uncharacterized membrane protein
MTTRHDRVVGVVWLAVVAVFVASMIAGLIQVVGDPSAEMAYRWVMALFFLGSSLVWLTAYYRDALRRFFTR